MSEPVGDDADVFVPSARDLDGARQAASVILLRDGATAPQVLMLRRAERAGDLRGGLWVFPGGARDGADRQLHARCAPLDDGRASRCLGVARDGLDDWVAAIRECFEETGLLLAWPRRALDAATAAAQIAAAVAQRKTAASGADFVALCQRYDLRLAADDLLYFSHWLTPPGLPKRFDTRFFVTRAPHGQNATPDGAETVEAAWLTAAEALDAATPRPMLPVTRVLLEALRRHNSVDEILADARGRGRRVVCQMPRLGRDARGVRPVLPDEPAWAEIGKLDPDGQGNVFADLEPLRAVRLTQSVWRITCGNGSMMTGPGTNTYVLRAPGSLEAAVIDPGPDDAGAAAHAQAVLAAAAPARVTRIFVTHTHPDHSPAAVRLRALTAAQLIGRRAAHPAWQDGGFAPDIEPADGQRFVLGPGCALRAVATPGHASNHVCWLLEPERLLFAGDHVMQNSTVVINPPDGDMAAYCASLRRLTELDVRWLAPGHGFLMAHPASVARHLLAHRAARERRIIEALRRAGPASVVDLLAHVYAEVPAARHALAQRSLLAHLIKLDGEGRVQRVDEALWRLSGAEAQSAAPNSG